MPTQSPTFTNLHKASYMSLTTFRKSGEPVASPVWFAQDGSTLYLFTFPGAGKLKRIRHTPRVTVAPCTLGGKVTGPTSEGKAQILTKEEEQAHADHSLARKYGLTWRLYNGSMEIWRIIRRRPKVESVYVAIEAAN